ncbi:MAG: hypothetical protein ACKVPX_11505 [Myxococcaceae bacterium]
MQVGGSPGQGAAGGATGASRANWQLKNPARALGGAAVLAALVGGWAFFRSRREPSMAEEFVENASEASSPPPQSADVPPSPGGTPAAGAENSGAAAQSSPNGTASPYPQYTDWVRHGSPPPPKMPIFPGEGIRSPKVLRNATTKGTWHVLPEKDPKTGKKWAALRNRLVYLLWSEEKADVLLNALSESQKSYLCKHIDMIRQLAEGGGENQMDDFAAAVLGTKPPGDILSRRRFWLDAMLMSQYLREALPKDAQHLGLEALGLSWRPEVGEVKDGLKHMQAQAAKARAAFDELAAHGRSWPSRMVTRLHEAFGGEVPNYRLLEPKSRAGVVEDYAKRAENQIMAKYFGTPKVRRMAALEEARRDGGVNASSEGERPTHVLGTVRYAALGAGLLLAYNLWRRSPSLIPEGRFWQHFFGQSPQAAAA